MAYVGGKSKGSSHIISLLNDPEYDGMNYLEPFVGYAHILRRVERKKSYTVSDANPLVACLLKGIQGKKVYPDISRDEYYELKTKHNDNSFRRAIAAFCYSYNGKEWGGYTKASSCKTRTNYPQERKNYYDKLRQNDIFMNAVISCRDYKDLSPVGYLIYCDPPYSGRTGYSPEFDSEVFWDTMRKWSKNNIVFISEYTAPKDFICISEKPKSKSLNGKGSGNTEMEKVFTYNIT